MNEFESQGGSGSNSGIEELRSQLATFRLLMCIVLGMLFGLSICADYYLSKQTEFQNNEATQLQGVVDAFPQNAANDFVKRLREYAKTHPDFAPITVKYAGLFGAQPPAAKK